jgi:hypothetical protein
MIRTDLPALTAATNKNYRMRVSCPEHSPIRRARKADFRIAYCNIA